MEKDNENRRNFDPNKKIKPGQEFSEISGSQAELYGINENLKNNLEINKLQADSRLSQNQLVEQFTGMNLNSQSSNFNSSTQDILRKYGVKPGITNSKSNTYSGGQSITNNNRTEINIVQPNIPVSSGSQQDNSRFKSWITSIFSKQKSEYDNQQKEYRKKESSLTKSANKMMRRIEAASKDVTERLDPRNMGATFGGQLKSMLWIFSGYLLTKFWKPAMTLLSNVDNGVRSVFGLPSGGDLKATGREGTFFEKIKEFIGIDMRSEAGKNKSLLQGIGDIFSSGINKLIARFDLFLKDRQIALREVKFPDVKTPNLPFPFGGLMDGFKATFAGISEYLGNLLAATVGGSKGSIKIQAGQIGKDSQSLLQTQNNNSRRSLGDEGILRSGAGRNYMKKDDYDSFGNVRNQAGSTYALSQTVTSLMNDKSGKINLGAVGTGLGQLQKAANTYGQAVIDPDLLNQLGLTPQEIVALQASGKLKTVRYKWIKKRWSPSDYDEVVGSDYDSEAARNREKSGMGMLSDIFTDLSREVRGGIFHSKKGQKGNWVLKAVPIDSNEESFDGSKPVGVKDLIAITSEGFEDLQRRIGTDDLSLSSPKMYDFLYKKLIQKKKENGVHQPLVLDQNFDKYNTARSRYNQYETAWNSLDNPNNPIAGSWNRFSGNVSRLGREGAYILGAGLNWAGGEVKAITGAEQKRRVLQAMNFFINKGYTKEQAAGIVGNLMTESGMRHNIPNESSGAYGLAQWLGDRPKKFQEVMGKPLRGSSFEDQLEFIDWELKHRNGGVAHQKISQSSNVIGASDMALGWFEFHGGPGRAQAEFERYGQYGDHINPRRSRSQNALSLYNNSIGQGGKGSWAENLLTASGELVGSALQRGGDYLQGKNGEKIPNLDKLTQLELKQNQARLDYLKRMFGAKIEGGMAYIDNGSSRVYLNSNSYINQGDLKAGAGWDIIDSVVKIRKDGTISGEQPSSGEREGIIKDAIRSIESAFTTYPRKGTSSDYMTDSLGKKLYIAFPRNRYSDYPKSCSVEVIRLYNRMGGIAYWVLLSKDGSKVMEIKTDSVTSPITLSQKVMATGQLMFARGRFKKFEDPSKPSDWNPVFLAMGITLTPLASQDLQSIKDLYSGYKELSLDKSGLLNKIVDSRTGKEISGAEWDVYKNLGFIGGNMLSPKILGNPYKSAIDSLKTNVDVNRYYTALGLGSLQSLQNDFKSNIGNDDKYYKRVVNGVVEIYDIRSGFFLGTLDSRNNFTPVTTAQAKEMLSKGSYKPEQIQSEALDQKREKLFGALGRISLNKVGSIMESVSSGKVGNEGDFQKWIDQGGKAKQGLILTQPIGKYRYFLQVSGDGKRITHFKPMARLIDGQWHLIKADGTPDMTDVIPTQPQWYSMADAGGISGSADGISKNFQIQGSVHQLEKSIEGYISTGKLSGTLTKSTADQLLRRREGLVGTYKNELIMSSDTGLGSLFQRSLGEYRSGSNPDNFITDSKGRVMTKDFLLLGRKDKTGNFIEGKQKDALGALTEMYGSNKAYFYKAWFGAKEDRGELVVDDSSGTNRIVLDLSAPLNRDLSRVVKSVKWREDGGSWKDVNSNDSFIDGLKNSFLPFSSHNSSGERKNIIDKVSRSAGKRARISDLSLLSVGTPDIEKGMKQLSKASFNEKPQEQQRKLMELQAQVGTDSLTLLSRIANNERATPSDLAILRNRSSWQFLNKDLLVKAATEYKADLLAQADAEEKAKAAGLDGKGPIVIHSTAGDHKTVNTKTINNIGKHDNNDAAKTQWREWGGKA